MELNEIISLAAMVFGGGGFLSAVVTWRKAKPEKVSYEIKNLREVIDEVKKTREEDKKEAEKKMDSQDRKIQELEIRDNIKSRAISQWMKCHFIPREENCPVAEFIESSEKTIQRKIERIKKDTKDEPEATS